MRSVDDLRRAVSRATCRSGLEELITSLGLFWDERPVLRGRDGVWCLAEHGTLRVLLTESRVPLTPQLTMQLARMIRGLEPVRPILALIAAPDYASLTLVCFAPDGDLRHLSIEPGRPLASELDVLRDMIAEPGEPGVSLALRYANAMDSAAVGARFFAAVRMQRAALSAAWKGLPAGAGAEREQLSLLLLCRLMFLYFLQRQGHLAGDTSYLIHRVRLWQREGSEAVSLYRGFIVPLFFGVLNTRPERRTANALALGALPYLNGGLFERHAIERRFELDLPDRTMVAVFDELLERFRFTASDPLDAAPSSSRGIQIDPEMLGRVFEGLMSADRRGETGTFYTPPAMVDRLCATAFTHYLAGRADLPVSTAERILEGDGDADLYGAQHVAASTALREVRVLDPACGSGAFLLGALSRVAAGRVALGEDPVLVKREVVGRSLHGVDLLDDAALLCSLRLWLALADVSDDMPPPLPNLDRRIRQGYALLDPLQALSQRAGMDENARALRSGPVRAALAALAPLAAAYVDAEPETRLQLRSDLRDAERALAHAWLSGLHSRLGRALRDAVARSESRDLWNEQTSSAVAAGRDVRALRRRVAESSALLQALDDSGVLPFFSFHVHFADTPRFDVILSNPPWIRSHKWPAAMAGSVRDSYVVCERAGWPAASAYGGSRASGQVDLSLLFLERSVRLLNDGGVLAMLLPAKVLRSLYAGGARALIAERLEIISIDDFALDQRSVFRADAFTCAIVARKRAASVSVGDISRGVTRTSPPAGGPRRPGTHVRMTRRNVPDLEFEVPCDGMSLIPGDHAAPWLLAPPDAVRAFRAMMGRGRPVAQVDGLDVRRGIVTGANDVLIVRESMHRLGGLSQIKAEGYFRARKLSHSTAEARRFTGYVETETLRPLIRGSDVRAWRAVPSARVLWTPSNDRRGAESPVRLRAYLKRHDAALRARTGIAAGASPGTLMRVGPTTLGHKVVWHDIAETLHAAAVPDRVKGDAGGKVPVLPLNTVYFVAVGDRETALLLTAYLNSMPMRCLARAAAERAKDARFRFFAWTVGMLPLPHAWRARNAGALTSIAQEAHDDGGLSPSHQARLDALVADAYGLTDRDFVALQSFDHWLSGVA